MFRQNNNPPITPLKSQPNPEPHLAIPALKNLDKLTTKASPQSPSKKHGIFIYSFRIL